jgi:hypothetical protein
LFYISALDDKINLDPGAVHTLNQNTCHVGGLGWACGEDDAVELSEVCGECGSAITEGAVFLFEGRGQGIE